MITPVILSGGAGTRLWPLSRSLYPKQLLPLVGTESMLVETARRFASPEFGAPLIICSDQHRFIVAEQVRQAGITPSGIILEPVGRNTAPAAAIAALAVAERDPQGLLLLAASDHAMTAPEALQAAIAQGLSAAQAGKLVTFGIQPTRPETGYGYIQRGASLGDGVFAIDRFVEKPNLATAEAYVADGGYWWNASLFLFRADRFLEDLGRFRPDILEAAQKAFQAAHRDLDFLRLDAAAFKACPSESIDYALMEKSTQGAVVPVDPGWSDVGAWTALWEIGTPDADGTVSLGDVWTEGARNSYLRSEPDAPLIAAVGIDNLVVVSTRDAVLVAHKDKAQDVKKIVDQLKAAGRSEAESHAIVYRPWGSYEGLVAAERYQVKRIVVKPGEKLSLQMHHHRAEHWVVVAGTAKVTRDQEDVLIFENQSIYIPMGATHRLENPGKVPLHLIEVQSGAYLGEDDIVRLDDKYGRN